MLQHNVTEYIYKYVYIYIHDIVVASKPKCFLGCALLLATSVSSLAMLVHEFAILQSPDYRSPMSIL